MVNSVESDDSSGSALFAEVSIQVCRDESFDVLVNQILLLTKMWPKWDSNFRPQDQQSDELLTLL